MKFNFKNCLIKNSLMFLVALSIVNPVNAMDYEGDGSSLFIASSSAAGADSGVSVSPTASGRTSPVAAAAEISVRPGSASPSAPVAGEVTDHRSPVVAVGSVAAVNPVDIVHDARVAYASAVAASDSGSEVAARAVSPSNLSTSGIAGALAEAHALSPRSKIRELEAQLEVAKIATVQAEHRARVAELVAIQAAAANSIKVTRLHGRVGASGAVGDNVALVRVVSPSSIGSTRVVPSPVAGSGLSVHASVAQLELSDSEHARVQALSPTTEKRNLELLLITANAELDALKARVGVRYAELQRLQAERTSRTVRFVPGVSAARASADGKWSEVDNSDHLIVENRVAAEVESAPGATVTTGSSAAAPVRWWQSDNVRATGVVSVGAATGIMAAKLLERWS